MALEDFPYTGLYKTYSTYKQVPDSAGTATALLFTGVKTKFGMLGLDKRAESKKCDVPSSVAAQGKEVGLVTNRGRRRKWKEIRFDREV